MSDDRHGNRIDLERSGSDVPTVITNSYSVPQTLQPCGDSVGLTDLVTSPLWRGRVTIAIAAILGILMGYAVSLLTTPTFRARASLQLEGFNNDPFLREVTLTSPLLPNASAENYLQNEVKLLESETLARRVADKLGALAEEKLEGAAAPLSIQIKQLFSLRRPPLTTPHERRIKNVQKALSVRTSLQSQVIELFFRAPDPKFAARGANLVASEFLSLKREARWQSAQDTTEWLNRQAEELRVTLEKSNQELWNFARSAGLVFGKQSTLAEDGMRQLQEALAKSEVDRASKESRYQTALAYPEDVMADALATEPLRQNHVNLQNLSQELAQLQTLYTPTSYKVQRVQAQIAEAEKAIRTERKKALARLRTEYLASARLEGTLSAARKRQLKIVEQQTEKQRLYDVKKSEIEATQRLYESVLQKVKEAGAASAFRATNVRMIDSSSVPSVPYSPNEPLNMAIGLAVGSLGGIGLVLAREGSGRIRRPGESILEVPELGVIPSARGFWSLSPSRRGLIGFRRQVSELGLVTRESLLSESFRATLTSIVFGVGFNHSSTEEHRGRVLVVTSVDMMEGKTTILTNLGVAAAEGKRRVLLIDADLRRPRVHNLLDLPNTRGLTDVLQRNDFADFADKAPLELLVHATHIPNLWVLPSGVVDETSSRLLYSSDLSALLRRFRREFDLVLIDTPPMMPYADGRVLGRMSDGVIMVVRANTLSRQELRAAYLKLMQDQTPVLGTILNDWKMDPGQIRAYGHYRNIDRQRPA